MIGNQIKKLLLANDMTQAQLAQKMNISESKMSKILSGSIEPNLMDLKLMAQVFNVSIDEIVIGETKQTESLIESAIKEGFESFSKLIKEDPSWVDRKDDKGHNMIYYIKKYEAYDMLTYFYQPKNLHVPSAIQIYYIKMIETLIKKKLFDKYLEIDSHQHSWDFSALDIGENDDKQLNLTYNKKSNEMIYEVLCKTFETSNFYDEEKKDRIAKIELTNYIIYGYQKSYFRELCNQLLMKQNVDPKYIIGFDNKKEYFITYYANNRKILNKRIEEIKESRKIPDDIETLNEALFIAENRKDIIDLMSLQIDLFEDIDFNDVCKKLNESSYMSILSGFNRKIIRIKEYLILAIKYNDLELFKHLISLPKLLQVINSARKERLVYSDYGSRIVTGKFFDFVMPFIFQKEVMEKFPEYIDEITINYEEIIKSENSAHYQFALNHLTQNYFDLPFFVKDNIETLINRPLDLSDCKKLIDTIHSTILEFMPSYLESGKLDYDAIYKNLVEKSFKNPIFKYLLVKIWINVGNTKNLTKEKAITLFKEGIESVEKIQSVKEKVIDYIFFEYPTYVDNLFRDKNLYSLLPKIKNIKFFKLVISGFNPNIFSKYIKENNLVFADLEKVKYLFTEITYQLSYNDLALLIRTLSRLLIK